MSAPSPFFEGTRLQSAWDQTSLGLLMECPRKYEFSILEGWRPRSSSHHLVFGGLFATAMEHFHKYRAAGAEYDEAVDMVVSEALSASGERLDSGEFIPWESGDTKKSRETLIRSIVWYFEEYREDSTSVVMIDGKPAVELTFKFDSGIESPFGENYLLTGHIDRLVTFDEDIFVMDQKTTGGGLGPYYFHQFDLDQQMSQYTFAGRVVYDMPVQGVIIDAAQIMVGFTSFARGITMRSSEQLEEWHQNAGAWLALAAQFAETGQYPMNLKSCNNYGGCAFKSICSKSPSVRMNFLQTDFEIRRWNPLENRD